jgi:D-3-phosphoglycerate dehydrogenase / 2-oxoglutarate reductase
VGEDVHAEGAGAHGGEEADAAEAHDAEGFVLKLDADEASAVPLAGLGAPIGGELQNKTLGVVGLGRIGFLTAMRARAFGMNILAHDEYINPDSFTVSESRARLTTLDDLLANSDFISCHVPETPQTLNLFNYNRFSQMKPTAFFLNAARGKVVDEPGLIRALKDKKIAGAALDVRATEPPQKDELQEMDNVILMPHIAAFTNEAQERVVACVCKDVSSILSGQPAKNFFNFARPKKTNG